MSDLGVVAGLQLLQADGAGAGGDELLARGGFLGLRDPREVLQVREHAVGRGPGRGHGPQGCGAGNGRIALGEIAACGGFAGPHGAGARAGAGQPGGRLVLLELAEAQEPCQ